MSYAARPTASFGYFRGNPEGPFYLGQGSGMGMAANTQGVGVLSQGQGAVNGPGGWHPTVLYLGVFIFAEMVAFAFIARMLK